MSGRVAGAVSRPRHARPTRRARLEHGGVGSRLHIARRASPHAFARCWPQRAAMIGARQCRQLFRILVVRRGDPLPMTRSPQHRRGHAQRRVVARHSRDRRAHPQRLAGDGAVVPAAGGYPGDHGRPCAAPVVGCSRVLQYDALRADTFRCKRKPVDVDVVSKRKLRDSCADAAGFSHQGFVDGNPGAAGILLKGLQFLIVTRPCNRSPREYSRNSQMLVAGS